MLHRGERSVGEKAGHSQVSLWRDWKQTGPIDLDPLLTESELKSGEPIPIDAVPAQGRVPTTLQFRALQTEAGCRMDQVGLILPTSLCSGQIAQMIAHRCNERGIGEKQGISGFVALPHTEGCGVSGGRSEEIYTRTMIGHLTHPKVALGLLLEHGCEKTHNDHVRHEIQKLGISPERYGWASVQLDGGIDAVIEKVQDWFSETLADKPSVPVVDAGLEHLCIAVTSTGEATGTVSGALYRIDASNRRCRWNGYCTGERVIFSRGFVNFANIGVWTAGRKGRFPYHGDPNGSTDRDINRVRRDRRRFGTRTRRRCTVAIACNGAAYSGFYGCHDTKQLRRGFGFRVCRC